MTAADASPGFYGNYAASPNTVTAGNTRFFPSPSAGTNYPDSTVNIGWAPTGTNTINDFTDPQVILPGSIGQIGYFRKEVGPFKGDAESFMIVDSGILFADWNRWSTAYKAF